MFYFDYNPKHGQYGVIKQQFWTLLHFPFHLSIVLSMEGLRQLSTLHGLNTYVDMLFSGIGNLEQPNGVMDWFTYHFNALYDDGTSKTIVKDYKTITEDIANLEALSNGSNATDYELAVSDLLSELLVGITEYYGMKAPKPKKNQSQDYSGEGKLGKVIGVFNLVYEYYFVSFGTIFLIFGIFTFLVRPHRNIYDFLAIAIRVLVGISMFAMVGLYTVGSEDVYYDYLYSPWPIPQVCIILVSGMCRSPE